MGNGSAIGIFTMTTGSQTLIIKSSVISKFFDCDAQVSILIDREWRYWIDEAVDNIFLPHKAILIKSIPISLSDCIDKLIWPLNLDGEYSMRSSYRLMLEEEMNAIPS